MICSASKKVGTDVCTFAVWSPPVDQKDPYLHASYRSYQAWRDDPVLSEACKADRSWWPRWLMSKKKRKLLATAKQYRAEQREAQKFLSSLSWASIDNFADEKRRRECVAQGRVIAVELACDCWTELQVNVVTEAPDEQSHAKCPVLQPYWLDASSGLILGNGIESVQYAYDGLMLEVPPGKFEARVTVCYRNDQWKSESWIGPESIRVDLWPLAPGRTITPTSESVW